MGQTMASPGLFDHDRQIQTETLPEISKRVSGKILSSGNFGSGNADLRESGRGSPATHTLACGTQPADEKLLNRHNSGGA
jgi:hypothetical protein